VPTNFDYDISLDYQYDTPEQSVMEHLDDDPLLDTLPLALRRARQAMHSRVWYTPRT
jgi:hypothetical protein